MSNDAFDSLKRLVKSIVPLTEAEWDMAVPMLSTRTLNKNDFLVRSGETCNDIGFVVKGLMRKFYVNSEGDEFINTFMCENQFTAPYESMLQGRVADANLQAVEKTDLIVFNFQGFQNLSKTNLNWKEMRLRMTEMILIQKEKRQVRLVMNSATERYEDFLRDHANLVDRVPNYQIASYIGITPEALSRILRKMKSQ